MTTKAGRRNSSTDAGRLQQIHDLSVDNGADCAPSGKSLKMPESLDARVREIYSGFWNQFSTPKEPEPWPIEAFDDKIIVMLDDKRYEVSFTETDDGLQFAERDDWVEVETVYAPVKGDDTLVVLGSEVKALGDGKVGGYLVRFGDEDTVDLQGDYFTKSTDFGMQDSSAVLYHHGLDPVLGRRLLGEGKRATLKKDDVGVWIDAQLNMRDDYEKALYELVEASKMGWSSGTAPHLVTRARKSNGATEVLTWPLGIDASITPGPAEPRNSAMTLKTYQSIAVPLELKGAKDSTKATEPASQSQKGQLNMEVKELIELLDKRDAEKEAAVKAAREEAAKAEETKKAAEVKQAELINELVEKKLTETLKGIGLTRNDAGELIGATNLNLKTEPGDDAMKAFMHYMKTGDNSGLRADSEAYKSSPDLLQGLGNGAPYARNGKPAEGSAKTTYDMLEGTQYQGQELVPTEVYNRIMEFRDPKSIARANGAIVIPVGSNAINVPIEKTRLGKWVITSEASTYDENAVQPLDKLALTIYKYTRLVQVAEELLDDSVASIEDWLMRALARSLARTENEDFLVGTGSGEPTGAMTSSGLGETAAGTATITFAETNNLYYSLNGEYRDDTAMVMRGATEGHLRGLTGNPAYFSGGGERVSGFPQGDDWLISTRNKVYNTDEIDALATGNKTILYGNFEAGYVIADRKRMSVFRDPYSDRKDGLINFLASTRMGAGVGITEAFKHMIMS